MVAARASAGHGERDEVLAPRRLVASAGAVPAERPGVIAEGRRAGLSAGDLRGDEVRAGVDDLHAAGVGDRDAEADVRRRGVVLDRLRGNAIERGTCTFGVSRP